MNKIEVVAGIVVFENEILCMQRGKGKFAYVSDKFEFPGGKVEPGESHIEALKRELKEEMEIDVFVGEDDFFLTIQHQYPDFALTMHNYVCKVKTRYFVRKEHIDHKWLTQDKLNLLDWAPADIPIVEKIAGGGLWPKWIVNERGNH